MNSAPGFGRPGMSKASDELHARLMRETDVWDRQRGSGAETFTESSQQHLSPGTRDELSSRRVLSRDERASDVSAPDVCRPEMSGRQMSPRKTDARDR